LKALANFLSLLNILITGAPKEQPPWHAPHRDGDIQLAGNAQDIVFHSL
jgi:hypothetical protein